MKIGILAVQGDFEAHAAMLRGLGVETVEVRTVADLQGCDGIILPGGESTTQLQFLQEEGLFDAIQKFSAEGRAVFGTCAGAILLATQVKNPEQASLGLVDMTVLRNGYGRQLASDVFFGPSQLKHRPVGNGFYSRADHRIRRAECSGARGTCRQARASAERQCAGGNVSSGIDRRYDGPRTFSADGGQPRVKSCRSLLSAVFGFK